MSNHVYDLCTKIFGSAVYRGCCGYRKAVRFLIFVVRLRYLPRHSLATYSSTTPALLVSPPLHWSVPQAIDYFALETLHVALESLNCHWCMRAAHSNWVLAIIYLTQKVTHLRLDYVRH